MAVLRELALGVGAIIGIVLSVLVINVFYATAFEMGTAWWAWIIGGAVATGFAAVAAGVLFMVLHATVGVMVVGWMGMLTGRQPVGYGPGDHNLSRGLGGVIFFAAALVLGRMLYRAGVDDGQVNWAVEGLMLMGGGTVIGLFGAVPRLYYAARGRGGHMHRFSRNRKKRGEASAQVSLLLSLALVSIALSMCVTDTVQQVRARSGAATLAYGDWFDGCVEPDGDLPECAPRVSLRLVPRRAVPLRVEYITGCRVRILTASGDEVPGLSIQGSAGSDRRRASFDAVAGVDYRVELEASEGARSNACVYSVRYFDEPDDGGRR